MATKKTNSYKTRERRKNAQRKEGKRRERVKGEKKMNRAKRIAYKRIKEPIQDRPPEEPSHHQCNLRKKKLKKGPRAWKPKQLYIHQKYSIFNN